MCFYVIWLVNCTPIERDYKDSNIKTEETRLCWESSMYRCCRHLEDLEHTRLDHLTDMLKSYSQLLIMNQAQIQEARRHHNYMYTSVQLYTTCSVQYTSRAVTHNYTSVQYIANYTSVQYIAIYTSVWLYTMTILIYMYISVYYIKHYNYYYYYRPMKHSLKRQSIFPLIKT